MKTFVVSQVFFTLITSALFFVVFGFFSLTNLQFQAYYASIIIFIIMIAVGFIANDKTDKSRKPLVGINIGVVLGAITASAGINFLASYDSSYFSVIFSLGIIVITVTFASTGVLSALKYITENDLSKNKVFALAVVEFAVIYFSLSAFFPYYPITL